MQWRNGVDLGKVFVNSSSRGPGLERILEKIFDGLRIERTPALVDSDLAGVTVPKELRLEDC